MDYYWPLWCYFKDAEGKVIGERMDNLIHASATNEEAEREIKLWFKPNDIPPSMHAYTVDVSEDNHYLKDKKLNATYESGSMCFLAQGNAAWKSDLEALRLLHRGHAAPSSLEGVVAKYLINRKGESH